MKPTGKIGTGGTPMLVWQDYVAGTDPTNEKDVFTASITIVDGKVTISYTPELDDARDAVREKKYCGFGRRVFGDFGIILENAIGMRTIRFWTSHNCRDGESWRKRLYLPEEFRFVFDETDPEYLLVSEHLYADAARMKRFFELNDGSRIIVWHNGEAVFPDMNLFDYAYVFDREATIGDRICRIPTDVYFDVDERFGERETVDPDEELRRKTGFCSFIYGNPHAHPRRDQLFHLLNSYKRVDALGPHLNNCGNRPSRMDCDWHKKLVAEKRPYKFSIASENATYSGYVSEKLTSSFRAHVVPIYWGDPTVAAEYNPEAFINANGMTDAEVLAAVKRVDEDDALWKRMIAAPYKTEAQFARVSADFERVKAFSLKVFDERSAAEKKRAPAGYWNGIYRAAVARQFAERKQKGFFWRMFG